MIWFIMGVDEYYTGGSLAAWTARHAQSSSGHYKLNSLLDF